MCIRDSQKGGRYFCWFCDSDGNRGADIAHILNSKTTSLSYKTDLVLQTTNGKSSAREQKTNYYDGLDKASVIGELHERKVKLLK